MILLVQWRVRPHVRGRVPDTRKVDATPRTSKTVLYDESRALVTDKDLKDWLADRDGDGRVTRIRGLCPRCGDQITHPVVTQHVEQRMVKQLPLPGAAKRLTIVCTCGCDQEHQDSTPQQVLHPGCGAWWLAVIVLEPEDNEQPVRAASDDSLLLAAQAAQTLTDTEETVLRSAAEKWIGAVTALIGLFGLAGVLVGKDAFVGLPDTARVVAGAAGALAVIAAGTAVVFSYKAAYGWPTTVDLDDDVHLADWYSRRRGNLTTTGSRLRNGVFWAMASLAMLSVVAGCVLFWPHATPAPAPLIQADYGRDNQVCGTLLSSTKPGEVRIRQKQGTVVLFDITSLGSVTVVGSCP